MLLRCMQVSKIFQTYEYRKSIVSLFSKRRFLIFKILYSKFKPPISSKPTVTLEKFSRPEDRLVKRLKHDVFNHNKYLVTACDASTVGRSFLLCQLKWLSAQSWRSGSQQYYVNTESSDRVIRTGKSPLNFRRRQWLFCSPLHQNMLRNRPNLLVYGHWHITPAHKEAGIRTPVIEVWKAWCYLSTSSPTCIFSTCSLTNLYNPVVTIWTTCCEMQQNTSIISPNKINYLYIRDGLCSLRRRN